MATYRELLAQVRGEIDEISTIEAHDRLEVTVTYPWKLDVLGLTVWQGTMSSTTQAIIE